jgi:hypothetical protein
MFAFTILIAASYLATRSRSGLFLTARARVSAILPLSIAAAVGLTIGLIPFCAIYLPLIRTLPSRSFREYVSFAPFPYDVINVSSHNALWGWAIDALLRREKGTRIPQALTVTPGMILIFLLSARAAIRNSSADDADSAGEIDLVAATVAVLVVSWLLIARIGSVSLYWLPDHLLPGVKGYPRGWQNPAGRQPIDGRGASAPGRPRFVSCPVERRKLMSAACGAIFLFCCAEQINFM